MIVRRGLALGAVGVALVLVLGGCTDGGGEPTVTTTTTVLPTTATSAPTPPDPPDLLAAATQPNAQGATAFFEYFLAAYNYGYATTDSQLLRDLSAPGCKFCSGAADDMDKARAAGRTIKGGEVRVATAVAAPGDAQKGLVVDAIVNQAPSETKDQAGHVVAHDIAKTNLRLEALVQWQTSQWKVLGVDVLRKP